MATNHQPALKDLKAVPLHATCPSEQLIDNSSFQPLPDQEHDEQLFRGSPLHCMPCGHSEAIPRHYVHAANPRCVSNMPANMRFLDLTQVRGNQTVCTKLHHVFPINMSQELLFYYELCCNRQIA
jgi:hypothetical protein